MTIHFFTFSDARGGSSRQRAFRVAEKLQERGIDAVIHWPPVLTISRTPWPQKLSLIMATIRSLFCIKKGDVLYLHRTIANKYFFVIMVIYLVLFRPKMIFDFDDPVYVHSFFKTKTLARLADAVVVSSHRQEQWARTYNANVHVIHISVDFPEYQKFTKDYTSPHGPLRIGWVGSGPEHIRNLEILAGVFKKLLQETTVPFVFILIGALKDPNVYKLFKSIPGLSVEFIDSLDWTNPQSVPREIQKFDIGVLPHQTEGEWNKGKTSLKDLEYMACGVATIASVFGEIPYIISDGVNGYTAKNEDEWVTKLKKLLLDQNLRAQLGRAGQESVKQEYSLDVVAIRIIDLINSLTASTISRL